MLGDLLLVALPSLGGGRLDSEAPPGARWRAPGGPAGGRRGARVSGGGGALGRRGRGARRRRCGGEVRQDWRKACCRIFLSETSGTWDTPARRFLLCRFSWCTRVVWGLKVIF